MSKAKDLKGMQFGKLTVIEQNGRSKNKCILWRCICQCGNEVTVQSNSLLSGNTKSCGCLHKDGLKKRCITHGMTHTRVYRIWCAMKERCNNPHNISYKYYGGRGIKVCEEWSCEHGAENFIAWAMKNGYQENLTIDRIDSNANYSPENCRWIPIEEQQSNKRNNHLITYQGKTQTLTQWAIEIGITRTELDRRINKFHWSVEKALTTGRKCEQKKIGDI